MYFDQFPAFNYPFDINGKRVIKRVTDITVNVRTRKAILDTITVYDEYDVQEGETPEIISEKVYGSPLYHWVLMLVNDRYDYIEDWPLPQFELEQMIRTKYGPPVDIITTEDSKNTDVITVASTEGLTLNQEITYVEHYTQVPTTVRIISIDSDTEFTVNKTIQLLLKNRAFVLDPVYACHHYVNDDGFIVDEDFVGGFPVSNYDFETQVNESKRRIKLISNENLFRLLSQFKALV